MPVILEPPDYDAWLDLANQDVAYMLDGTLQPGPIAQAYEVWIADHHDCDKADVEPEKLGEPPLESCTIITTDANELAKWRCLGLSQSFGPRRPFRSFDV